MVSSLLNKLWFSEGDGKSNMAGVLGPEEKEGPDPWREQNEGTFEECLKEILPSEKKKNTLGREKGSYMFQQ